LPEDQSRPLLQRLWEQGGLEDALLPLLARRPAEADRAKFVVGLGSAQLTQVRLCLDALAKLPPRREAEDLLALVKAHRALGDGKPEANLRERLGRYLTKLTGESPGQERQAWTAWFVKRHPDWADRLGGADGVDMKGWAKRLAALDWSKGDGQRGREVYAKASCASCHTGSQALGPDLLGVTGRFSRDDLLTAIVQPNRDISPRYRTTLVETAEGQVYQGLVIYDATDSLILQTGPATTTRLANRQIAARRTTQTSLMPAGLLDRLTDQEIADLYAYLRSLK
jgi:putative heme-binding domain-containing protein